MITETDINAIAARIETVLRDIAVPKPSRIAEYYAGLTYSIVLLKEQAVTGDVPAARVVVIQKELEQLYQKRAELEEAFDVETSEHVGGS
jgi:hypothetical protein